MRKTIFAAVTLAAIGCAGPAFAIERVVDGVLGGLAGAIVAGPVGLVAGGLVGASAGPEISSAWGLNGSRRRHHHHRRHR